MTVQASWKGRSWTASAVAGPGQTRAELDMEIKLRFTEPRRRQRMAIMVTREPHCFEEMLDAFKSGGSRRPSRRW